MNYDRQDIEARMELLCSQYLEKLALIDSRKPRTMKWDAQIKDMEQRRALQIDFYEARAFYENLLDALLLPPSPPPTPAPPQPAVARQRPRRPRGRPSSGGRRRRDRRVNKDDDDYVPE